MDNTKVNDKNLTEQENLHDHDSNSTNSSKYGSNIVLTRSLFLRLVGLTYLGGFLSIYFQIQGIWGDEGIFPANNLYKRIMSDETVGFMEFPILIRYCHYFKKFFALFPFLQNFSDVENFLHFLCLLCIIISILIVLNNSLVFNPFGFFILWISYITFTLTGQTFMNFQWDVFISEVGFLTILFVPITKSNSHVITPIDDLVYMLIRFLMFRFMFSAGVVKVTSQCPSWQSLTSLHWHFESQPLPNMFAWYAHQRY